MWRNELTMRGYCLIQNSKPEDFECVCQALGEVIFKTDVIVNPDSKALVTSERALDLHTDHHKADFIAWYCLEQTDLGGETILADALEAFQTLPSHQQDLLQSIYLHEHRVFEDDLESYPLVEMVNGLPNFYYSFWLLKEKCNTAQMEAAKAFDIACKEQIKSIKLQKNEILIVNNRRVLHGRKAIEGSKNRHLKRYWIATKKEKLSDDQRKPDDFS